MYKGGPVKVQKQSRDESTLYIGHYPTTEHGKKERQGIDYTIHHVNNVSCK